MPIFIKILFPGPESLPVRVKKKNCFITVRSLFRVEGFSRLSKVL